MKNHAEESKRRAYGEVCALVESLGGRMQYRAGGGPGGVWEIDLTGND
jgi:hypothetical protein